MIVLHWSAGDDFSAAYCYLVARQQIFSDMMLAAVLAEQMPAFPRKKHWQAPWQVPTFPTSMHKIYEGQAWLGQAWRSLCVTTDGKDFQITVDGIGQFGVGGDGIHVWRAGGDLPASHPTTIETMLGPSLILALALQNSIYCLHASAVLINGQAIAFVGESGQGKSTLAHYLSQTWQRLGDDILPIGVGDNAGIFTHPHFPQLKLPLIDQYPPSAPASIPLRAIFVLKKETTTVSTQRLSAVEATLLLIRHTVASRLFSPNLLAQHTAFCANVAQTVPVYQLSYPHIWQKLPAIQAEIESFLD